MEKKKIYLICTSIAQILLSIYSILNINNAREAILSTIDNFPSSIAERVEMIYSKNGIFVVPNIICIILAALLLIMVLKNKLSKYRGFALAFSIICFMTSTNILVNILSVINLILIATTKAEEKEKMPELEKHKCTKNKIISSIILLILYFAQMLIPNFESFTVNIIVSILCSIALILCSCYIFKEELKRDVKTFIKNIKGYLSYIFPRLGIMYLIYFVVSFICIFILNLGVSKNQTAIEALPIWYTIPLAVIYAPIVEELLFRGCIKRLIKNDIAYIIISGITFGLLHTIGESTIFGIIVMMFPYAILGSFFAYLYTKTNNICSNIFCHFFHNSLAMLILLMTL